MFHRLSGCLVVFAILIVGASCTKLDEPGTGEQKVAIEMMAKTDAIPLAWGKLVSVSSGAGTDRWVQLWFQDDAGTIRMVPYNVSYNHFSKLVRVIGRD